MTIRRAALFVLMAILPGPVIRAQAPPAAPSAPARAMLSQAIREYKAGNLDGALQKAQQAERAAGADRAAFLKALDLQASIGMKKKDPAIAEGANIRRVLALDDKQRYHSIGAFSEFEAALKRDTAAGVTLPRPALDAYLKLGRIAHKLTRNRDLAVRCYRITLAFDHESGESEEALEALGALPPDAAPSRPVGKLRFHAFASFWMLSETLTLVKNVSATPSAVPLAFDSSGPCVGAGVSYGLSAKLELGAEACGLFASGAMVSSSKDIDYNPSDVSVIGGIVSAGAYWMPLKAPLGLGLEIPVLIRQVDAPALPADSDSAMELPVFDFGAMAAARYRFGRFGAGVKAGYSPGFSTLLISGQLLYQF